MRLTLLPRKDGSSGGQVTATGRTDSEPLWRAIRAPATVNRWLLFCSEALQGVLLYAQHRLSAFATGILAGILLYNAASLFVLQRVALRRKAPVALLLILDLLLVCAAASVTGASKSPFLGQLYLIIFAGALFFGLAGGIATGIAASLMTAALGYAEPAGLSQDVRDLIPYFPIAGAFTGYLSSRLRDSMRQREAEAEQEHLRKIRDEGHRHEMELARAMQETAMASGGMAGGLPEGIDLDIAIHRSFADEVGGDFALTFPDPVVWGATKPLAAACPPRTVGLVVGDVSGKGVPAALIATSIAYLLPWLRPLDDVDTALAILNRDLARRLPDSAFVTMAVAEVVLPPEDAASQEGRIRLWSAGHPPAVLWRAPSHHAEIVDDSACGPVLGIFPEWECATPAELLFAPGDILVLYSDGLIETRRPEDGDLFETERVSQIITTHADKGAETLVRILAAAAADWGPQHDDLTILVCRRKPANEPIDEGG